MKKVRNIGIIAVIVLWAGLALFAWFGEPVAVSLWERRPLQQMPSVTADTLLDGSFMDKFADYTVDQFPLRNDFRTAKSLFAYYGLRQKDNNGIYLVDGAAAKLEYPLQNPSVSNALKKINGIYEQYLQDTDSRIFMTVIPDKGYYLAAQNGYPAMDYTALYTKMTEGVPYAQYVDITGTLSAESYYRTDTHWRQERLFSAAQTLCGAMGVTSPKPEEFTPALATQKFYGVYYGQAALPMAPDDLYLLENDLLKSCRVYNHETQRYQSLYDREKLESADPYEVYLSGSQALLTIENPNGHTDRELIVFRDSFASSIVPLLLQDYSTVTLVDTRYISTPVLGQYLTFRGQDVLFAYSTLLLNNSATMK